MSDSTKTDYEALNRQLYERFKNGDAQALERLLDLNKRIAFAIAKKYYFLLEERPAYDLEDIQQIATIGLWEAITSVWDPDKGGLYTPAKWVIARKMREIFKSHKSSSLNAPVPGGEDGDAEKQDRLIDENAAQPDIEAYASERCREYLNFIQENGAKPVELNRLKAYCYGYGPQPTHDLIKSCLIMRSRSPVVIVFRERWLGAQISYYPSPMAGLGKIRITSSFSDPTADKAIKRLELTERLENKLRNRMEMAANDDE